MRIGLVTQWFPPEPGTLVAQDIAAGLRSAGHEVDVLTGFPNYPTGIVTPGYRVRPYQREVMPDGVVVHRAPLYPSHDGRAVPRALNYLSFAAGALAVASTRLPRPDAWLVYSSPATAALPALAALGRQAPVTLLVQDLWPDSVTGSGFMSPRAAALVERVLSPLCSLTYDRSAAVCVISPSMQPVLARRMQEPDRIRYTPNWVSDGHLSPDAHPSADDRRALGLPPTGRLFLYAGNIGELQGLDPVVEAFIATPQAQLVIVGEGVAKGRLQARVTAAQAANITFVPQRTLAEIGAYLAAADVQVVPLQDTPLLRATMPSKVQTAMASGRAILACAVGDVATLVTSTGAGVAARPGDVASIASAVRTLVDADEATLRRRGAAARSAYLKWFTPAAGVRRLASVIESTVSPGGRP